MLIIVLMFLPLDSAPGAPSQWQGHTPPTVPRNAGHGRTSEWLVLNTGGSGGMFGKGDIRQKLLDVHFWNDRLGWACGVAGAFRTEDGGLTWERMKPYPPRGHAYYHVEMTSPSEVWLLEGKHPGGLGKAWLWYSMDAGKTWCEVLEGKLAGFADLFCRGSERWVLFGVHGGNRLGYRSTDGGRTWRVLKLGGLLSAADKVYIPGDVSTEEGFVIYVLGSRIKSGFWDRERRLLKSVDGGKSWAVVPLPEDLPAPFYHSELFFATSSMGWIGLPRGEVLFTDDGGSRWRHRDLPDDQMVTALWFDQLGRGFAAVWNGFIQAQGIPRSGAALYRTRDAGRTWVPVLSGQKNVNAIFASGPGRVWAVGDVPGFVKNDFVAILQSVTR